MCGELLSKAHRNMCHSISIGTTTVWRNINYLMQNGKTGTTWIQEMWWGCKEKKTSIEGCSWREDGYKVLGQHWLKKIQGKGGIWNCFGGKKDKRPLAGRAENLLGRPSSDWICSTCVISFWETSHITDYATVDDFSSSGMAGGKYDTNMRWQAGSEANLRSPVKTSKKCKSHCWEQPAGAHIAQARTTPV